MKTSNKGIEIIKKHEGLKLKSYLCPASVWTIGYGHTKTAKQDQYITTQTADNLLKSDLSISESAVNKELPNLTQNQFDALVSFVFNVGSGNFRKSTLLKKIKDNATEEEIRNEFSRWNKGGGQILGGLVKRRLDEANLYFEK
jgi:lysozyme